ncbi:hypothetical protein [Promicromonospora sp. NPDC023987]|uniref:hypothetical protein n=1 Tax=Promicromonospora sp. NPDC023987 TaxID=3155360 RepID=UPI003404C4EA
MTALTLPDLTEFPGIAVAAADGVPVLLAPREGNTGGGIIFRVGSAHETLATSGITHLIEHLALREQVLSEAHLNGQTHADVTLFHVAGSATDVVTYLNDVCAALRDLPMDRIDTEKDILRSEAEGKHPGFGGHLRISRHGARGFGLVGYGERGIDRITHDEVLDWAASWFTRENAVAWVTADTLPEGLDLSLPKGTRRPPPVLTDVLQGSPAYLTGLRDGVALDAVVPRGNAAYLASLVLREVLHRDLRGTADIASTLDVDYDLLNAEDARLSVVVQGTEGQQGAVAGGLADALSTLRFHVTDEDLAAARAGAVEDLAEVAAAPPAELLPSVAHRVVTGRPLEGPERIRAQVESITADDVRAVAREAWGSALWYGPDAMDWAGIVPAPNWSEARATGRTFQRIDAPDVSLVLAVDGVGMVTREGGVTVRFVDCVLMESVPDGARVLTGADGFRLVIEPTLYRGLDPSAVAAHVDSRVPANVVVHLPAREPDEIPVAQPPAKVRTTARDTAKGETGPRSIPATVGLVLGMWVVGVLVLGGGQVLLREAFDVDVRLGFLPVVGLIWATYGLISKRHPKAGR